MTLKEFECGLFGGLLNTGRQVVDQFLISQGDGDLELVKDRLERTGMRWSANGVQAMLSLRCLSASDAWDDFQKQFLNPTRIRG